MMNSILKYKIKRKIIKGIKTDDKIIYGTAKDKIIKNYFEQLYSSRKTNITILNNGIFDYKCYIKRAIDTLSKSNAVGLDGIPWKTLKQEENTPIMIKIKDKFNLWIRECKIPKYMMKGKLLMISKDKSDSPTIDKTRPISILPAITKFFESSILHTLVNWTQRDKFCNNQRGFTKGKSTLDNIKDVISLATSIKDKKHAKESPALVFFDFSKTYDSVPRDKLIQKLLMMDAPWNIIKIINNMLENFTLTIGKETIKTPKGLIQGSVLSPTLFNLFINDLLVEYKDSKIESRAYADDIICICSNMEQVKKSIQIMKSWWEKNEMKINKEKSGILRILKRKGKIGYIENELKIPEVESYKYLGDNWINLYD